MPARGYPLDIDAIILFELARGAGSGPEIIRRARERMHEKGYKLHYGSWYPALRKLADREMVAWTMVADSSKRGRAANARTYVLTEKGLQEAQRLSTVIRSLILPPEPNSPNPLS